jgi:hypothetical protein
MLDEERAARNEEATARLKAERRAAMLEREIETLRSSPPLPGLFGVRKGRHSFEGGERRIF